MQDSGSDLNVLRAAVVDTTAKMSNLLSGNSVTPSTHNTQSASTRSGELTPTLLHDEKSSTRAALKSGATSLPKSPGAIDQKPTIARDPFVPFFSIKGDKSKDAAFPLTEYELSDLRVTAIVGDSSGRRSALVETSDGKSFVVNAGTKIGDNGGRVETITTSTIVISEPAGSAVGGQETTTRELSLKILPTPQSGTAQ